MSKIYTIACGDLEELATAIEGFQSLFDGIQSQKMLLVEHGELEHWINKDGTNLLKLLLQANLSLRAQQRRKAYNDCWY